jgi:hypothetical protein
MEATLARCDDDATHREEETHAHGPTPIVALEVRSIRFDSMTIDERFDSIRFDSIRSRR